MDENIIILRNYDVYKSYFRFDIKNATAEQFFVNDKEHIASVGYIKVSGKGELIAIYRYRGELHVSYCEQHFLLKEIQSIEMLLNSMYLVKMKIVLCNSESIIISEKIITEQFVCDFTPFVDEEDFSILRFINNIFKNEERQVGFLADSYVPK